MLEKARVALNSLILYRDLLQDPAIASLRRFLDMPADQANSLSAWHDFAYYLYQTGHSYQEHWLELIRCDDNPFSSQAELFAGQALSPTLLRAVAHDLKSLQFMFTLDLYGLLSEFGLEQDLIHLIPYELPNDYRKDLPLLHSDQWGETTEQMVNYYREYSRGLLASYRALRWVGGGRLEAVANPDPVRLVDLIGYHTQKEQVLGNTEQFLNGGTANNILLYGNRGTGKSSMIKALLNQYRDNKLALVEVHRDDLVQLPTLTALLRRYNVFFIIFVDDLSFEDYETDYKGLKAVMEGSLEGRAPNVLIYATSNRRNLIRESFADRTYVDEEIHARDTMEEKLSLADRFGLTITFPAPNQQQYLEIVEGMAERRQLNIDPELLRRRALEWERAHHGPSGRTARQFLDSLKHSE